MVDLVDKKQERTRVAIPSGSRVNQQLIAYLSQFITEARSERIDTVLKERTRYVVPVLEDLYQPHNISAAIRSVECCGVQDVHIIEQQNRYTVNSGVSKGSSNWVSTIRYNHEARNNTHECFETLRSQGYRVFITSPHIESLSLQEIPLDQKCAVVFGTEERGVSLYAQEHADGYVKIPMYGFTESFNVSVCVAICLHLLTERLRASNMQFRISEEERLAIKLSWLRMLVRGSEGLERKFLLGEDGTEGGSCQS